jgi:hypothetical protein
MNELEQLVRLKEKLNEERTINRYLVVTLAISIISIIITIIIFSLNCE